MKNIIFLFAAILFGAFVSYAQTQVVNDAEAGSRNTYASQCWAFGAVTVSDTQATLVAGKYSFRTNQVTSADNKSTWIKSPWIIPAAGNITFDARLDGTQGGNRSILVQYIPYDESETNGEGKEILFSRYDFPNPINNQTTPRNITAAVPATIVGKPHKIFISFVGTGGTARVGIDDLVIPGQYYSDPSSGCIPKAPITDEDGDGVVDAEDAYPKDPYRAFDNPFPAKGFSTLMFEDLWPALGDYDFNDLVVDYRINRVTDAKGEIVEVIVELKTRAAGAGYRNGFGIEFSGVKPTSAFSVEGSKISGSVHSFSDNGTEAGTDYLTIIPYDNVYNVLAHLGQGTTGVNTNPAGPFGDVVTQKIVITLKQDGRAAPGGAVRLADLGPRNFNPFLIANQKRGVEVHLPGKQPTALADASLFGTNDDGSTGDADSKYRSKSGKLPWALHVTENVPYLHEGVNFLKGYLKFADWVKSNGSQYEDWYLDNTGYRNGEVLLNVK